ncbi:MAG: tetratricopeptide repeat protein [Bacteroidales bacterium]|nr:tetratricopeptide repeat protein [Candidatus Equimonas faecalis]
MQVTELIGHPELLSRDTLSELRRVVGRCPYYHAARLLLVENLFMLHDPDFEQELRAAALLLPDRSVLFDLVESLNYDIDSPAPQSSPSAPLLHTGDRTYDLIGQYLQTVEPLQPATRRRTVDPLNDYMAVLEQMDDAPVPEGIQEWPDTFIPAADSHRFGSQNNPEPKGSGDLPKDSENCPADTENYSADSTKKSAAGEAFPDPDSEIQADAASDAPVALPEAYFTETLAKVFIKQGSYERAIEILTKINLANPRKNAYFADQIRFLQKLVLNNKHKQQQ